MDFLFDATGELEGNTLSGVVHVFGTQALKDGVLHEFDPHSFDKALRSKGETFGFYAHDETRPLASRSAGSLRLRVDGDRLTYSMDLGQQSYALDLRENVRSGLMTKMSFGVGQGVYELRRSKAGTVRYHTEVASLFDISPVTMPAFEGTAAQLHAAGVETNRSRLVRARARVMEASA